MISLPTVILRNFWLKFFSVALATVIWLGIHYGIRNELTVSHLNINNITVPITVLRRIGDPRVFKITPSEVTLFAVGDKHILHSGVKITVDLTNFRLRQSAAEELHVEAAPEINILEVSPSTVAVEQISR